MFDILSRIFGEGHGENPAAAPGKGPDAIIIATTALLLEMAHIDGNFNDSEKASILSILKEEYELSEDEASELLREAEKELEDSIQLWQFTNLINENYSREDKIRIIELIWRVIFIDGKLDKHEDYLVHKLARLLNLKHSDLIDAKLRMME